MAPERWARVPVVYFIEREPFMSRHSKSLPKLLSSEFAKLHGIPGQGLDEGQVRMGLKAILVIAGAGKKLSAKTMAWLRDELSDIGTPEAVIDAIAAFDYSNTTLEQIAAPKPLNSIPGGLARNVLFRAIRTAQVDGYSDAERASVAAAAQKFGIPAKAVKDLEEHAAAWQDVDKQDSPDPAALQTMRKKRQALLAG